MGGHGKGWRGDSDLNDEMGGHGVNTRHGRRRCGGDDELRRGRGNYRIELLSAVQGLHVGNKLRQREASTSDGGEEMD